MGALTLWQYIRDFGTGRLARLCFIDQSPKLLTDAAPGATASTVTSTIQGRKWSPGWKMTLRKAY